MDASTRSRRDPPPTATEGENDHERSRTPRQDGRGRGSGPRPALPAGAEELEWLGTEWRVLGIDVVDGVTQWTLVDRSDSSIRVQVTLASTIYVVRGAGGRR